MMEMEYDIDPVPSSIHIKQGSTELEDMDYFDNKNRNQQPRFLYTGRETEDNWPYSARAMTALDHGDLDDLK